MKRSTCIVVLLLSLLEMTAQASPVDSVVRIRGDRPGKKVSLGAGFFVSEDGTIATAYHVIQGASALQVTTTSNTLYEAPRIVWYDNVRDLALLQIELRQGQSCIPLHIADPPPDLT